MKFKIISIVLLSIVLSACGSTSEAPSTAENTANEPQQTESATTAFPVASKSSMSLLNIEAFASFKDDKQVAANVLQECHSLGSQFSQSTERYAKEYNLGVQRVSELDASSKGTNLKLYITSVYSGGNAFIGHRKSVSIMAELYKNGKKLDEYSYTRNSGGGFMGGFKGSCSVLKHTVNTLGNDVAKWLKTKEL